MKQQFFVGDSVRICDTPQEDTYVLWDDWMGRFCGAVGEVVEIHQDNTGAEFYSVKTDNEVWGYDAKWLTIVERQWQKNTGEQPVDDDVEVEIKLRWPGGKDKCLAGEFRWDFEDCSGDIVEWRIADSGSSSKEQPEAVPPSHIALGNGLVQVGGPYMKIWCDTCQGTGEIDERLGGESFSSRDATCPNCEGKGWWERVIAAGAGNAPVQQDKKHSHYFKKCGYDYVDVYRVLKMFDVTDPCISHACKKLLVSGGRGFKDIDHDVQDVIDTLVRWQEMRKEDSGEH